MTHMKLMANLDAYKYDPPSRPVIPPKLPDSHVFDPDQTVNWNRKKVEENNAERARLIQEHKEQDAACAQQFRDDCIAYIQHEVNKWSGQDVPTKVADAIFYRAYEEGHSSGYYTVVSELDELLEFLKDLYLANKEASK